MTDSTVPRGHLLSTYARIISSTTSSDGRETVNFSWSDEEHLVERVVGPARGPCSKAKDPRFLDLVGPGVYGVDRKWLLSSAARE